MMTAQLSLWVKPGAGDHRHIQLWVFIFDFSGEVETVSMRQRDIDRDEIRVQLFDFKNCFFSG